MAERAVALAGFHAFSRQARINPDMRLSGHLVFPIAVTK